MSASKRKYDHIIVKYHKDPRLIRAIIQVESNWNHKAVSSEGAIGLMQVLPKTAKAYGVNRQHLFNPEINIKIGCAILKDYQRSSKSLRQALTKYVGGDRRYYRKVMRAYAQSM
jgi:soluble lytic murein transglycosylase-like protein